MQRLERNVGISTETLALFVRFWLTITPPLPSDAQAAAQVKGRERYEGFIEALGRRLQKGQSLFQEIPNDVTGSTMPGIYGGISRPTLSSCRHADVIRRHNPTDREWLKLAEERTRFAGGRAR